MKRHGIVLGTWFDEKRISYLQMYHCMTYYILLDLSERGESNCLIFSVGRQSLWANNTFLILHCDHDAKIT